MVTGLFMASLDAARAEQALRVGEVGSLPRDPGPRGPLRFKNRGHMYKCFKKCVKHFFSYKIES